MKKLLLSSLVGIWFLTMQSVPLVEAATTTLPMNIQLIGDAKELAFNEQVFVSDLGFLPGESVERVLTIENQKDVPFRLSFELERVSQTETYDLLDQINVEIYEDDTLLCTGTIDENTCDERQFYAVLNPGDIKTLKMIASFDEAAGNEYKNKFAQYDWIFDAIVINIPTTGEPIPPVTIPTTGLPNTGTYGFEIFVGGSALVLLAQYVRTRKKNPREQEGNENEL